MVRKLCNYLIEKKDEDIISCRRLGTVRFKTCEKCAFNFKNKKLLYKAKRYYGIIKA